MGNHQQPRPRPVETVKTTDLLRLVEVWEAAVRSSHWFIDPLDIELIKPLLITQYFAPLSLLCIRDAAGKTAGFIGIAANKIEMLFVHPEHQRQGIGQTLLSHAVTQADARWVDVNEQNHNALAFYQSQGFMIEHRSALDGGGRPKPILHLRLTSPRV